MDTVLYGGIEAGGTKFICAVGDGSDHIHEQLQIPTTSPEETMLRVVDFFKKYPLIQALGIGSFGPVDLDHDSRAYGHILNSPKQAWTDYDILAPLRAVTEKLVLTTDVNCAAIGEHRYGAGKDLANLIYVTVGTGIGGGCIVDHKLLQGLSHPEIGHLFVPQAADDEQFAGVCPYHGNCLEGLASGPAIQKRWGVEPEALEPSHRAWDLESRYLAYGIYNLVTAIMPQRIIVGGGIMNHDGLLERIQQQVAALLGDYINLDQLTAASAEYLVGPELGKLSAVTGALYLASQTKH